ncbi:MAG: inorganic diphosphatase [Candidatus Geothermincolia bacterium]
MPVEQHDDFPALINVVIEIQKGSRNKYEYDHASGLIKLDRVLFSAVHYPAEYGYAPQTRAEDGDEVDVMVLIEEPTFPGCLIQAVPVGMLKMEDEKGLDYKILAVPTSDPRWNAVEHLHQVPDHLLLEIENFFLTYKMLETKETRSEGWFGHEEALAYLRTHHLQNR